ncbi:MAG: tetratricopeptide repeat protein [Bacteroidetes bacterium]|nr:tetratricopeptide repeat protein [Bacteroidota bacterium]
MNTTQEKALRAYEQREYEAAVRLLQQAAAESSSADVRERLLLKCALAQDELGKHTEALETLKTVLEQSPESAGAWNNLGLVCLHIGKYDEARAACERAYTLNPELPDALVNLGVVCLRLSDPLNALQYLTLALEHLPGHPAVHANLALTYAVFGRLEEAEDALRLAILYGYEHGDVIGQKLEALKAVREEIVNAGESKPDVTHDSSGMHDDNVPDPDSDAATNGAGDRE